MAQAAYDYDRHQLVTLDRDSLTLSTPVSLDFMMAALAKLGLIRVEYQSTAPFVTEVIWGQPDVNSETEACVYRIYNATASRWDVIGVFDADQFAKYMVRRGQGFALSDTSQGLAVSWPAGGVIQPNVLTVLSNWSAPLDNDLPTAWNGVIGRYTVARDGWYTIRADAAYDVIGAGSNRFAYTQLDLLLDGNILDSDYSFDGFGKLSTATTRKLRKDQYIEVRTVHTATIPLDFYSGPTLEILNHNYVATIGAGGSSGGSSGLDVVTVRAPLAGDGTVTNPLDIDFGALAPADTQALATRLVNDATSLALLAGNIGGDGAINVSAPLVGTGSPAQPIDVNFNELSAADTQAIASKLTGDAASTNALGSALGGKIGVATAPILSGNGTSASPLDVNFAALDAADARAIVNAIQADPTAIVDLQNLIDPSGAAAMVNAIQANASALADLQTSFATTAAPTPIKSMLLRCDYNVVGQPTVAADNAGTIVVTSTISHSNAAGIITLPEPGLYRFSARAQVQATGSGGSTPKIRLNASASGMGMGSPGANLVNAVGVGTGSTAPLTAEILIGSFTNTYFLPGNSVVAVQTQASAGASGQVRVECLIEKLPF